MAGSQREAIITLVERTSRFFHLHDVHLNHTKTIYTTSETTPQAPPAVFTNNKWTPITQKPPSASIRYLGLFFDLKLSWRKQKGIIRSQLGYYKNLIWRKQTNITEANYIIDTALISSLLYKLQLVPHSTTEIDRLDSSIVAMRKGAAHLSKSSSSWIWYSPSKAGGLQRVRLKTRLVTLLLSRLITVLNGASGVQAKQALTGRIAADTISRGETTPLLLSPPKTIDTRTQQHYYAGYMTEMLHTHGLYISTVYEPNPVLLYKGPTREGDTLLKNILQPHEWEGLHKLLQKYHLIRLSDVIDSFPTIAVTPWRYIRPRGDPSPTTGTAENPLYNQLTTVINKYINEHVDEISNWKPIKRTINYKPYNHIVPKPHQPKEQPLASPPPTPPTGKRSPNSHPLGRLPPPRQKRKNPNRLQPGMGQRRRQPIGKAYA